MWNKSQIFKELCLNFIEIFTSILICHISRTDVKLEIWSKVLKVIVVWEFCNKKKNQTKLVAFINILDHTTSRDCGGILPIISSYLVIAKNNHNIHYTGQYFEM